MLKSSDQKLFSVVSHFLLLNFETQRGIIHAYVAIQIILNKKTFCLISNDITSVLRKQIEIVKLIFLKKKPWHVMRSMTNRKGYKLMSTVESSTKTSWQMKDYAGTDYLYSSKQQINDPLIMNFFPS